MRIGTYKVVKEGYFWYIKKRFLFWWIKVPDSGFGWGFENMTYIAGCRTKSLAEKIINEHYLDT